MDSEGDKAVTKRRHDAALSDSTQSKKKEGRLSCAEIRAFIVTV